MRAYSGYGRVACDECGLSEAGMMAALFFLRDMGMLMWYDENGLRDAVIMDLVAYFVKPATRLICERSLHNKEIHDICGTEDTVKYDAMVATGIMESICSYVDKSSEVNWLLSSSVF
jgi:hypothetical protein